MGSAPKYLRDPHSSLFLCKPLTFLSYSSIMDSSSSIPIPTLENRNDGWKPGPRDISETPGGTMVAFTPGGTKLTWSRDQMMHYANSPLSKSPLKLPVRIPKIGEED